MRLKIAKNELEFDQKPTLNKNFWDNEKLNSEVKDAIMAIVESFLESTNIEIGVNDIDEIEFTGSLANYNYSNFSDVDIHLLFDFSKLGKDPNFMQEFLGAKAIIWNAKHNVALFGHEVELYITAAGTDHHSTGVYSVKDDKWLVKPVRDPKLSAELNLNKVKDKADKVSKEIDMLVVKDELNLEKIKKLKDKIKKMRIAGLETDGEFSTENLAFKLLRRRGELNTLSALMKQARDEELSLDEDVEWWKKRRHIDNKNYRELMGYVGGKGVFKRKYAAKSIGYPKSVSRRKLSKLGAPYMMDPPKKLPKSAPPGVAESVLKEYTQEVIDKAQEIKKKINDGQTFELNLDNRSFGRFKCLEQHTYQIKKEGDKYRINLKQNIKNIITPMAQAQVDKGKINPIKRCVYYAGDAVIGEQELNFILLSELRRGNVIDKAVVAPEPKPEPEEQPEEKPEIPKKVEPETPEKVEPKVSKYNFSTKDITVNLKPLGGLNQSTKDILDKSAKIIGVIENSKKVSFKVSSLKRDEGIHGEGKAVDFKFIINGRTISDTDTYAYLISLMAEGLIPDVSLGAYAGKYDNQKMNWTDRVHIDSRPKRAWFWFKRCKEGSGKQAQCNGVPFNGGATKISGSKRYPKRAKRGAKGKIIKGEFLPSKKHKTSGKGISKSQIIDNNVMRFPVDLINRIKEIRTKVQKYKQTVVDADNVV
jgi:hypothetical protein